VPCSVLSRPGWKRLGVGGWRLPHRVPPFVTPPKPTPPNPTTTRTLTFEQHIVVFLGELVTWWIPHVPEAVEQRLRADSARLETLPIGHRLALE